jgi:hypothetical protein
LCLPISPPGLGKVGGAFRSRTGLDGFAIRYITALLTRLYSVCLFRPKPVTHPLRFVLLVGDVEIAYPNHLILKQFISLPPNRWTALWTKPPTLATPRNSKKFSNAFNCLFCGRTVHNADAKASGMLILYASAQEFTGKSVLFSRQESLTRALSGFSFAYGDGVPCITSSWGASRNLRRHHKNPAIVPGKTAIVPKIR